MSAFASMCALALVCACELCRKEASVNLGLQKLIKGAEDVEAMKIVLAAEQVRVCPSACRNLLALLW